MISYLPSLFVVLRGLEVAERRYADLTAGIFDMQSQSYSESTVRGKEI